MLVRRLDRASEHTRAPSRGSNIALNSLARFALNDVFLIKIPSKGKKTIVSRMIKDVHVSFFSPSMSKCATKAFVRVGPRLDRCRPRGRIRWSRGSLVRTHRARVQQVASKRLQGARRPIEKKKKKSKAMTEARRNERAKCAAKVKERSDTRRRQARTTAAHGGRQR